MMVRDDRDQVVNLQRLFNVAVYLPGGLPLVKQLVKLPRNPLFNISLLGFLWYQHAVVSGYGMADDLKLGLRNLGNIFGRTKSSEDKSTFVDTLDTGGEAAF